MIILIPSTPPPHSHPLPLPPLTFDDTELVIGIEVGFALLNECTDAFFLVVTVHDAHEQAAFVLNG